MTRGCVRQRLRSIAARDAQAHFCEAEVQQLDVAIAGDHHVLRLEIAMGDAVLVRARKHVGDFRGHAQRFLHRHWA